MSDTEELRQACEAELAAAKAFRSMNESPEVFEPWRAAHEQRMRLTHPTKMLALLDALQAQAAQAKGEAERLREENERLRK